MHSVTFGLELRIPPKDSLTHTAAAARVPDALTQIFCKRHVLRYPRLSLESNDPR